MIHLFFFIRNKNNWEGEEETDDREVNQIVERPVEPVETNTSEGEEAINDEEAT